MATMVNRAGGAGASGNALRLGPGLDRDEWRRYAAGLAAVPGRAAWRLRCRIEAAVAAVPADWVGVVALDAEERALLRRVDQAALDAAFAASAAGTGAGAPVSSERAGGGAGDQRSGERPRPGRAGTPAAVLAPGLAWRPAKESEASDSALQE